MIYKKRIENVIDAGALGIIRRERKHIALMCRQLLFNWEPRNLCFSKMGKPVDRLQSHNTAFCKEEVTFDNMV